LHAAGAGGGIVPVADEFERLSSAMEDGGLVAEPLEGAQDVRAEEAGPADDQYSQGYLWRQPGRFQRMN
jgi:hypothetical protein